MNLESKRLSVGFSLLVLCAIVLSAGLVSAVEAYHPADVDFEADKTSGYAPLTVQFEDLTVWTPSLPGSFISVWSENNSVHEDVVEGLCCDWRSDWDFGDGNTASLPDTGPPPEDSADVSHVYTKPGTYTVTLTWSCEASCLPSALVPPVEFLQRVRFQAPSTSETKELYITVLARPQAVGGESLPVDKSSIVAPWVVAIAAIVAGAALLLKRRNAQG